MAPMVDFPMSSHGDAKVKPSGSAVLRYDKNYPRLELKTSIDGLSIGQMAALDQLGMLSKRAKPEPEESALILVAPDEDVDVSTEAKPETSDEVYSGFGPVMPHNPPFPRPIRPASLKFQEHQKRLDERYSRKAIREKPKIIKCSDLRIRIG